MRCKRGEVVRDKRCVKPVGAFYNPWGENKGDRIVTVPIRQLKVMRGVYGIIGNRRTVLFEDNEKCREILDHKRKELEKRYGDSFWLLYDREKTVKQSFHECLEDRLKTLTSKGFTVFPPKIRQDKYGHTLAEIRYRSTPTKFREDLTEIMRPVSTSKHLFSKRDDKLAEEYTDKIAKALKKKDARVPIVTVSEKDWKKGYFGEGRHRILGAERAGLTKMPILIYERT
jgi:hypothetical protein